MSKSTVIPLTLLALLSVGCGEKPADPPPTSTPTPTSTSLPTATTAPGAVCPPDASVTAGDQYYTLEFDGLQRQYLQHVPENLDLSRELALVLNMHGLSSTSWQEVLFSNMNPTADREGFIAVYPDGIQYSWNAGICCGGAAMSGIDDVGFLRAVVKDVSSRLCIDATRVYATGMSNGGYMANRLGCEAADLFQAIAPVAGAIGIPSCAPSQPIPVIAYHGVEDPLVSYRYGVETFQQWLELNGCEGTPTETIYNDSSCQIYTECLGGAVTGLCTMQPMGHCWPGGSETLCLEPIGPYNDDLNANDHMWEFFMGME